MPIRTRSKLFVVLTAFGLAVGSTLHQRLQNVEASPFAADKSKKARAAFSDAAKVFLSARCVNCHPAGDSPLQGDASKLHDPEVVRGSDGRGTDVQCNMCHLEKNTEGDHMPPGVPDWHMPSASQKMIFQGMTVGQICRNLKDPLKNGGKRTAKDAVDHLASDPKVLWAWSPGSGRAVPPMSHEDFLKKMNEWVAYGAACPDQ